MKRLWKKTCAFLTSAALTMTCIAVMPVAVSAADNLEDASNQKYSHVEFVTGTDAENNPTVSAKMFARDLTNGSDSKDVSLFCATYDENRNLVGVGYASGKNTLLKTTPYAIGNGQKTVAYIWDKENLVPVAEIATENAEITPTITFDGKSFQDYVGVAFELGRSGYDAATELKWNIATNEISFPDVSVSLPDKSAWYQVSHDSAELTTTIKLYTGDRSSIPNEPTYEYVIRHKLPNEAFMGNLVGSIYSPNKLETTAYIANGETQFTHKYTADVTVDSGTTKKIKFTANFPSQGTVIIVKPKDSSAEEKDVILKSDGNAMEWESNSLAGRIDYNAETKTPVYGERSKTSIDLYNTGASTKRDWIRVCRSIEASDDNYKTGSAITSDRFPHMGQLSVGDIAPDLVGYNYIPIPSNGGDKTLAFNINSSVEIICLTTSELTFKNDSIEDEAFTSATGIATDVWTHTNAADVTDTNQLVTIEKTINSQGKVVEGGTVNSFLSRRYMNEVNIWTAAAAIKALGISRDMFLDGWNKATFTYTAAGKTVSDIPQCVFMRYNDLFDYVEKFGNVKCGVSDPDVAARFKTLDAILDGWSVVSDQKADGLITDLKMDYTGAVFSPDVQAFPAADGVYMDRLNSENQTGIVDSYSDALELDSCEFIRPYIGWVNDSDKQYAKDYRGDEGADQSFMNGNRNWYHFTVKDDAEVLIASTGDLPYLEEDSSAWMKSEDADGYIKVITNSNNGSKNIYTKLYAKKFAAGATVQIKGGYGGHLLVFARRTPKTVSDDSTKAGISDIQILENGTVNASLSASVNKIAQVKLNKGVTSADYGVSTGLGSQIIYNRGWSNGGTYTNDLRALYGKYQRLIGCDYIMMTAGETGVRASGGFESAFTLHKDATVFVLVGPTKANAEKAKELGWTYEERTAAAGKSFGQYQINYGYYFTQLMTKHFKVQDKVNGDKITIPKEMLYMPDGGTGESIAVIVYD